ncbi:hypothetical protein HK100_008365 [Physocladia obscura]|uniref:cyclin-dependent kinase n=1 Tax=Physocladia obscura TaxID=109957 RepID=A0AAD5XEM3_9FUNG|nr:hypothetical protein HK100_008365 [Physocladia obscura]
MYTKRTVTATKWGSDNDEYTHDAQDRKSEEIRNRRPAKKLATKQIPQSNDVFSDGQSQHQQIAQPQRPKHALHSSPLLSTALVGPPIQSCRFVDCYEKLNRIEEGSYGIVYRARDKQTGEIVALKKLKLENEKNGFPVTTLREIYTLLLAKHPNIVDVREIVVTPSYSGVFIVMEFVEHDLKSLMDSMRTPFLQSEIKTLMLQLISACECLHNKWIVHRDLKTSNLLMNNRGMMKVADFGLARRFGDPLGNMTQLVVTLWYRAPELLLGEKKYTTAIDMWSVGCIFAELVNKEPLAPGKGEIDQLDKIFKLLGTPTEQVWPGFLRLPVPKSFNFRHQPFNNLKLRFPSLTANGIDLMSCLLTYDPKQRITAAEALKHPYFNESPPPKDPAMFPTFPSKNAGDKRRINSPDVPYAVHESVDDAAINEDEIERKQSTMNYQTMQSTGFRLKFM